MVDGKDEFSRRVKRVSRSHGEEGIELMSGQRIRFRTRTKGGGRGFSSDCLILDEAMFLPETSHGALLPTLSARPNPQVWYAGSAVDQFVHDDGVVFARIRERGLGGSDESLAYFEWSAPYESLAVVDDELAGDPKAWAAANPGLGIRISPQHIENEVRSMDLRTFAVERLGIGDWPGTDDSAGGVMDVEKWVALTDDASAIKSDLAFAVDVSPDRSMAAVGVAGLRADELVHLEVVEHRRGTGWVASRVAELVAAHDPLAVIYDGAGPAGSLATDLFEAGVDAQPVKAREYGQACGQLYDLVDQGSLRHLNQPALRSAIRGATSRPLGDAWAWSRKSSSVDISPLVAVTLAQWGLASLHGVGGWVGFGSEDHEPVAA